MSLEKKKFIIGGYKMTDEELYNRIVEDSKSDYNWIASALTLVEVCDNPEFSSEYAKAIKIIILNCFANIEECSRLRDRTYTQNDNLAVQKIYSTLPADDKMVIEAKSRYLRAIINNTPPIVSFILHKGKSFKSFYEEWSDEMFELYFSQPEIDIESLRSTLSEDFDKKLKKAEQDGIFTADDAEALEKRKKEWCRIGDIKV